MGEWMYRSSALAGGEWSASRPGRYTPGERAPGPHWIGGWVDPRVGPNDTEKWKFFTPPGLELRHLGRPASSQSLYRLRYPGSLIKWSTGKKKYGFQEALINERFPQKWHPTTERDYCRQIHTTHSKSRPAPLRLFCIYREMNVRVFTRTL
jgi:hypothetical protein